MSHRHVKLIRSIFHDPPSGNVHWRDIESLLKEKRVFRPAPEFAKRAKWSRRTVALYRKLGVQSRHAAIEEARRRHLI